MEEKDLKSEVSFSSGIEFKVIQGLGIEVINSDGKIEGVFSKQIRIVGFIDGIVVAIDKPIHAVRDLRPMGFLRKLIPIPDTVTASAIHDELEIFRKRQGSPILHDLPRLTCIF